ncbi:MAG: hypothetical protein HPY90_14175 [Syntrophothermus sp.]|jgi:hypothetical protein|uniref:hypothetical protein n=1 Tax=Syntrophothermus sp. TaxID=2736299 RepID=UPI00257FD2CE|nr:hypothetical protein [Syntrophothermus sp.]MDN5366524.1 hypothetical protein [Thermacetogenium sp.]NSW84384.1 hypothetical protein [Syntrophothermus sp.]
MKRLIVKIGLLVMIIVIIVGIGVEYKTHLFKMIISGVYDNRLHGVSCEKLPTLSEVEQIVKEHQDLIREIENVNPGFIRVYIDSPCPGKGEIVIEYASHQDRLRIEELIGETFFGVPWKGINT